jgi:general stress protein 26
MAKETNLHFVREKIGRLRNAIMYVYASGPVSLPNDIVTATSVDENGHLWFLANSPSRLVQECEQSFPVTLRFYRKGVDFFMEVSGIATIVSTCYYNDKASKDELLDSKHPEKILVKMEIMNTTYAEAQLKKPKRKIELMVEKGYKWFLQTVSVQHPPVSVLKKLRQTN